jgi:hypothetical protein
LRSEAATRRPAIPCISEQTYVTTKIFCRSSGSICCAQLSDFDALENARELKAKDGTDESPATMALDSCVLASFFEPGTVGERGAMLGTTPGRYWWEL